MEKFFRGKKRLARFACKTKEGRGSRRQPWKLRKTGVRREENKVGSTVRWMIKRALKPSFFFFFFWNRRCNTRSEDRSNPRVPIRNTSHSTLTRARRVREGYRGVRFRVRAAKMRQAWPDLVSDNRQCRGRFDIVYLSYSGKRKFRTKILW